MMTDVAVTDEDERRDPADYDARAVLGGDRLTRVPGVRAFSLVGFGGREDILDDSLPLVMDGHGLVLPDGRALVYCGIPGCCCGWPEVAADPWQAADVHASLIVWHPAGPS